MKFKAHDVVRASGLSYRQLDYSLRTGILRLSGGSVCGYGVPRRFGLGDVVALAVLHDALDVGVAPSTVAPALRLVQRQVSERLLDRVRDTFVSTDGRRARFMKKGEVIEKTGGVVMYIFDLGAVVDRVQDRLPREGQRS
jgi:hypothetical protein